MVVPRPKDFSRQVVQLSRCSCTSFEPSSLLRISSTRKRTYYYNENVVDLGRRNYATKPHLHVTDKEPAFARHSSSLGLLYLPSVVIDPSQKTTSYSPWESLQELPELSHPLLQDPRSFQGKQSSKTLEGLRRALDIFERIQPGSPEHVAILSLLAETYNRNGQFHSALKILQILESLYQDRTLSSSTTSIEPLASIRIARAKVLFFEGHFEETISICEQILEENTTNNLTIQSARTGQALAKLLSMQTLDDAFVVKDYARMVVKQITVASPFVRAAALLNFGIAEALYAELVSRENQVDVPLDGSLRTWKEGLSLLQRQAPKGNDTFRFLQSRLLTNMAWGLLEMDKSDDRNLTSASDFIRQALEVYQSWSDEPRESASSSSLLWWKESLGRSLSIAAECYLAREQAVTAEGLLQSAVSSSSVDECLPMHRLELRNSYRVYASLCRQWEKRESEGDKLEKKANDLDISLPNGWRGKSGIASSMWFWTPSDF